jgi:hypothetical protein
MWFDGYGNSVQRNRKQTRYVIPAWMKGDRVLHRPTGFYGELVEMQTAGGEIWKMRVSSATTEAPPAMQEYAKPGNRHFNVHACDLELRS